MSASVPTSRRRACPSLNGAVGTSRRRTWRAFAMSSSERSRAPPDRRRSVQREGTGSPSGCHVAIAERLSVLDAIYRELLTDPAPPSPPTDDEPGADEAAEAVA